MAGACFAWSASSGRLRRAVQIAFLPLVLRTLKLRPAKTMLARGLSAMGREGERYQERAWENVLRTVCAARGRRDTAATACKRPMTHGPGTSTPHTLAAASGPTGTRTWLSRGAPCSTPLCGIAGIPRGFKRFFATAMGAERERGREGHTGGVRGQGGGNRNRGDEASTVFTNVVRGEKLNTKDLLAIKDKLTLYVKDDGSRQEMTVQQVLDEAAAQELSPVLVSGLDGGGMLVMKLMDVGRTRHDIQKKKREAAKKHVGAQSLKELRFGLKIDQNDLNTKMKQAKGFLDKGHRVRIFMQLKGAEFYKSQSLATTRLDEIAAMVGESGVQDGKPVMNGQVISTTLAPKSGAKSGSSANNKKGAVKDGDSGASHTTTA